MLVHESSERYDQRQNWVRYRLFHDISRFIHSKTELRINIKEPRIFNIIECDLMNALECICRGFGIK